MSRTGQSQYGMCEKCGADKVMGKKGIPYCSEKCWLNGQTQQQKTEFVNKGGNLEVKKEPNWDKIRVEQKASMEWLNAKNNACQIVSASIQKGILEKTEVRDMIKSLTEYIYELDQAKETKEF